MDQFNVTQKRMKWIEFECEWESIKKTKAKRKRKINWPLNGNGNENDIESIWYRLKVFNMISLLIFWFYWIYLLVVAKLHRNDDVTYVPFIHTFDQYKSHEIYLEYVGSYFLF